MNKATEATAGHIDLEGIVDLQGKSLDVVLFSLPMPTDIPPVIVVALRAVYARTMEEGAGDSLGPAITNLLKKIIHRSYDQLCQKVSELRSRDQFDTTERKPFPSFDSIYGQLTPTNFNLIGPLQGALRSEVRLVFSTKLTNADFIRLAECWGEILTGNELLREMIAPPEQRKKLLALLASAPVSVSAVVPKSASTMRAPTVAGPTFGAVKIPPLPSAKIGATQVNPSETPMRARTLAGPNLPPPLPSIRRDSTLYGQDETNLNVTASAGPASLGEKNLEPLFDRAKTAPWKRPNVHKGEVDVVLPETDTHNFDISAHTVDTSKVDAPSSAVTVLNGSQNTGIPASTSMPTTPAPTLSLRKLARTFGGVGALGVLLGLGLSQLTKSKPRKQLVVSAPTTVVPPAMQSRLPMTPEVTPSAPVITGYVPEPPAHIPVVPFTPGVNASVATAIRRSLIANHARTLVCVPGSGAKREMDFRYFIDAVTHIAANQSPLVRSWRLVGNVSTYTTTLDSIAPDCRSFAFTLYRGTSEVVPSTRVTFVTIPADLIAARRRSGRIPTPLPQSERINFAQ